MGLIKYLRQKFKCTSRCSLNEDLIPELVELVLAHGAILKDVELHQIHRIVRKGTERKDRHHRQSVDSFKRSVRAETI